MRNRRAVGVHDLLPPAALLGDERRPFQHRDVLLHRGEAHRVVPGARAETDCSQRIARPRMSRRVTSASAWKIRSTSASPVVDLQPYGCRLAMRDCPRKRSEDALPAGQRAR